jgi:hypothetical protein
VASDDESDVLIVNQLGTIHDWILDSESCFHIFLVREMYDEESLHLVYRTVHLTDYKKYAVTEVKTVTLEMPWNKLHIYKNSVYPDLKRI